MARGGERDRDRARVRSACRRGAGSRPAPTDRVGAGAPPAAAMPELLQDVGLDQRLNTQLPLNLAVQGRAGPDGQARRLLRQAAGDPDARVLRVPDAVHAGAERRGQRDRRAQVLGRPGIRDRHGQLRSERHAGTGARQEGELHRALQPPGGGRPAGISSPATAARSRR